MKSCSPVLIFSCEHASNEVPPPYAECFSGQEDLLATHRGYDLGGLELARHLAKRFHASLHIGPYTRLLCDLNRSVGSKSLFSEITRALPEAERKKILEKYHHPHRSNVEQEVRETIQKGCMVLHLAIHTFTPVLDGQVRNADIGLLYDPGRGHEKGFCQQMKRVLDEKGDFRTRMNYPYLGTSDCLPTSLRKVHPADKYLGIEIEMNQKWWLSTPPLWDKAKENLEESIDLSISALFRK